MHLVQEIETRCDFLAETHHEKPHQRMTKQEKINLIHSFLSMERKSVRKRQIQSILENQNVKLSKKEILEVKNIAQLCRYLPQYNPLSVRDFKHAHRILMHRLDSDNGHFRKEQVIVVEGKKVAHIPPLPQEVVKTMRKQFHYLKTHQKISWILKACVFHYGIQYIHPFADGNGRMGRIWQHLLLLKASPLFQTLLIGDLIKDNPYAYYRSLDKSDQNKNVIIFIEFCLAKIAKKLKVQAKKKTNVR